MPGVGSPITRRACLPVTKLYGGRGRQTRAVPQAGHRQAIGISKQSVATLPRSCAGRASAKWAQDTFACAANAGWMLVTELPAELRRRLLDKFQNLLVIASQAQALREIVQDDERTRILLTELPAELRRHLLDKFQNLLVIASQAQALRQIVQDDERTRILLTGFCYGYLSTAGRRMTP